MTLGERIKAAQVCPDCGIDLPNARHWDGCTFSTWLNECLYCGEMHAVNTEWRAGVREVRRELEGQVTGAF